MWSSSLSRRATSRCAVSPQRACHLPRQAHRCLPSGSRGGEPAAAARRCPPSPMGARRRRPWGAAAAAASPPAGSSGWEGATCHYRLSSPRRLLPPQPLPPSHRRTPLHATVGCQRWMRGGRGRVEKEREPRERGDGVRGRETGERRRGGRVDKEAPFASHLRFIPVRKPGRLLARLISFGRVLFF